MSAMLEPLPRTRDALEEVVENVRRAKEALPVPLALENVASLVQWPNPEMDEANFLAEVLERHVDRTHCIPMPTGKVRSLNLATAVGIVLYEALRQLHGW